MTRIGFINDLHLKSSNPIHRKDNYFQAILDKLEYVIQNTDVLFILGDLFDSPIVDMSCLNRINMLFKSYEADGHRIYLLLGNHDSLGRNKSLLPTSFGSLIISKEDRYFKKPITIDNALIIPITDYENIPSYTEGYTNILCGHALFEIPDDFTISREQIDKRIDYVILGHDHSSYEDEELSLSTTLFRIGSFARKEKTKENLSRNIVFLLYDTATRKMSKEPVPCEEGKNVFVEDFELDTDGKVQELDLSELKEVLKGKEKINLYTILKEILHIDSDTINLIQDIRSRRSN